MNRYLIVKVSIAELSVKDGEIFNGVIVLVSYQGEDDPEENFILVGSNGILFDDIGSIEEVLYPSEPEILIDELWQSYNNQERVEEIFDRLNSFIKEDHPEKEKQIIKDFFDKHVVYETNTM